MKISKFFTGTVAAGLLFAIYSGCSSSTGSYQSSDVYSKPIYGKLAAKTVAYEGPARNPVIIVHGFLGAKLKDTKTGKNVWGNFRGIDSIESMSDEKIRALAIPMEIGKKFSELKGSAVPSGMLESVGVRIMGINFKLDAYSDLIKILTNAGFVLEGTERPKGKSYPNLFLFYYDWRKDLPWNAARLHEFIERKRTILQKIYKKKYGLANFDVQFDVIAHSMGGLLSRYYLRYGNQDLPDDGSLPKLNWAGSKRIDKLLIVGTPNCGYLDTVLEMVKGLQVQTGAPVLPPGIIGTWPTYYQMMPQVSTRSVVYAGNPKNSSINIFDPKVWIKFKWGLADPKQDNVLKVLLPNAKTPRERRKIALDHLTKCLKRADQFIRAMQVFADPPNDVALFLFQGDAVLTTRQASVNNSGKLKVITLEPGDGKVLVTSTLDDLRAGRKKWIPFLVCPIQWTAVYRLTAAHMGITRSEVFADNMTFCLLVLATPAQRARRAKFEKHLDKKLISEDKP